METFTTENGKTTFAKDGDDYYVNIGDLAVFMLSGLEDFDRDAAAIGRPDAGAGAKAYVTAALQTASDGNEEVNKYIAAKVLSAVIEALAVQMGDTIPDFVPDDLDADGTV